jgi:hypothetical protein
MAYLCFVLQGVELLGDETSLTPTGDGDGVGCSVVVVDRVWCCCC